MVVFGTRPEAIKMAPLVKEMKKESKIDLSVVVTAQHREMLDQVLELFGIMPDYDLDIMEGNQSLSGITAKVLGGLEKIYIKEEPDMVFVHGDTSTTFVGALASFYNQIKVGHVEAGLRTYDKYSPFPEEINRHLTGVLADLNFAPTASTCANLLNENIDKEKIFVTGNTVIDALYQVRKDDFSFSNKKLNKIDFEQKKVILLTSHRRENLGQPMENIFQAVKDIVLDDESVEVVFPVHLNPKVRKIAGDILGELDRVELIEPLDYRPFINLMARSHLILTDSGGIQEEAPALGKPVLVLRDTTERPEAVRAGTVKMVGTNRDQIYNATIRLLQDENAYQEMASSVNPYGDGKAGKRISQRVLYEFGLKEDKGEEFKPGK